MKKSVLSLLLLIGINATVSATALTIYAGNDFYRYQDLLDTTRGNNDLYFDFGLALDNIGGSGLSFHTDIKGTNAFYDDIAKESSRGLYELSTGYFDWRSEAGRFNLRLGRQLYTNLSIESFDLDGLRVRFRPTAKSVVGVAAGLVVPTPYPKNKVTYDTVRYVDTTTVPPSVRNNLEKVTTTTFPYMSSIKKGGIALIDGSVSMIPFTTLTAAVALVPPAFDKTVITSEKALVIDGIGRAYDSLFYRSSGEKGDFRASLGGVVTPVPMLRLNGSGRYSLLQKGLDRYDGRLTVLPADVFDGSIYVISEKGRVDTTNYFSVLLHGELTEFGLTLNGYPDAGGTSLQFNYHAITFRKEGTDHFVSFDISSRYLSGGIVFGAGSNGTTIRPHAGLSLPFLKYLSLEASGEYYRVDETDDDNIHHMVDASGGLKMAFFPIGLTIYPRVKYIMNRYYAHDLRLLITTDLLINRFWGVKK